MRATFLAAHKYIGTGNSDAYDFDFKITEVEQLVISVVNTSDVETVRARGGEGAFDAFVDSVTINADGTGTLNLVADLDTNFELHIFLAYDSPTQPFEFKNKFSFTLERIEQALDWLAGAVQRTSWLMARGIRLHDAFDASAFDPQLPLILEADRVLVVSPTGNSLVQGPTIQELQQAGQDVQAAQDAAAAALAAQIAAEAARDAAAVSAAAALVSENNAETAATAADASADSVAAMIAAFNGWIKTGPFTVATGDDEDLTGEVTNHLVHDMVDYIAKVVDANDMFYRYEFTIMYENNAWVFVPGTDRYPTTDLGIVFTVDPTSGQINADNTGSESVQIFLQKLRHSTT